MEASTVWVRVQNTKIWAGRLRREFLHTLDGAAKPLDGFNP
jgi:hypothetical protein